jgi:hypothetical protein
MRRSGQGSGGGYGSRVVTHTKAPKSEPRPHARNPATVAQYGALVGNHVTTYGGGKTPYKGEPDFTRKGYTPPVGPTSLGTNGPHGEGRKVYGSGSQQQYGSGGAEKPAGRDILSDFGPDVRKP